MHPHIYDPRKDGPLYRYRPRRKNMRTVTLPKRVGPHVRLAFAEMARCRITYDDLEAASGIRRPTIKAWRRKNAPGLESLTAVLNAMGWRFLPVPAHVEPLPPNIAAKIAEVAALAKLEMGEVFAAAVEICARQIVASEGSARILAEIDAERAAHEENRSRKPANDNAPKAEDAA